MTVKLDQQERDFRGLRVGSFESRKKEEMTHLISRLGGKPVVAPSMREVPLGENKEAIGFGELLFKDNIKLLILFTGIGTRTLLNILTLRHRKADVLRALKRILIVARGPKPVTALRDFGVDPTARVPQPGTWREILKTIDQWGAIKGLKVAVQEYGESNRLFMRELLARGADVLPVPVYRAKLPLDVGPMIELIEEIIRGAVDVVLFTNSTQVDHVFSLARKMGRAQEFRRSLARIIVASVGPSCSDTLRRYYLPVDVQPGRPMMGALVAETAEKSSALLKGKPSKPPDRHVSFPGVSKPGDSLAESLFLKACRREKTQRTPVWLMRQAGRYMREYRELRAKVSFLELCKNSDLASEVTVEAVARLGVDAGIIFSDILLMVEPLGFELTYGSDEGPRILNPFTGRLDQMKPIESEESMDFVFDAIRKARRGLASDIPLIGFTGAPFTLASYLIEGKTSKNFVKVKSLMYENPALWDAFLGKITDACIEYCNGQVNAGAQAIQIFDSWVGCLSPEDFRLFALPYTRRLIQGIVPGAPVISFGTQTAGLLPLFRQAGGDVIGVDWRIELDEAWDLLGEVAIQGNLDPLILFSSPNEIKARVKRLLNQASGRPGHIFNLGHGVLPATPIENVRVLIDAVKELSPR